MRRIIASVVALLFLLGGTASALGISRTSFPKAVASKHISVFYTTTGTSAVKDEYAQQVLGLMEDAYNRLVTEGGLRPPRGLPIPVVLEAASPNLGGSTPGTSLGFDFSIQINPRMTENFDLEEVIVHELFHVLQNGYRKRGFQEGWAIEGTASIAPFYGMAPDAPHRSLIKGHLSSYWGTYSEAFKALEYPASLFWYLTAERYGGLQFLRRALEHSENLEWERAAQLAALEGGAPANTTFDSLWRSVVFDMVQGRMPEGYMTHAWLKTTPVPWQRQPVELTRGELVKGVSVAGNGFAYHKPLMLAPYSFQLVEVVHDSTDPVDLTVSGDAGTVEAYVVKPGPNLLKALQDSNARPRYDMPAQPPFDESTAFAALPLDKAVRLSGSRNDRTLVLLLRTGWWGHGSYRVSLQPSAGSTTAPGWTTAAGLPEREDSPGSPPPLTAAELAELKAGTPQPGVAALEAVAGQPAYRTMELTPGDARMWDGRQVMVLRNPPVRTPAGNVVAPATTLIRLLGGTANGTLLTLGDRTFQVSTDSNTARSSQNTRSIYRLREVPYFQGDELMASVEVFLYLGCMIATSGDVQTISCPVAP